MPSELLVVGLRQAAAKQIDKFARLRAGDFDDPEVVHDLRVALRRLRSAWRVAEEMGDKRAKKLRRRARRQALALGEVRDRDVLMLRVEADRAAGHVPDPAVDAWLDSLRAQREAAVQKAVEVLESSKSVRWLEKAREWAESGVSDSEADDFDADTAFAELGRHIADHAQTVLDACAPKDDAEVHQLRIEVKRLRYLIEFFKDRVPRAARTIKALVSVQDDLGEARDRCAASALAQEAGLPRYAAWLAEGASDAVEPAIRLAVQTARRLREDWAPGTDQPSDPPA
ncbi:MAG: CHAD domain-containing protein [Fimbriimonadaceae bacterium]